MRPITLTAVITILMFTGAVHAGAPKDAPPTLMLEPGKLLVDEPLNRPMGKEWFAKPGKWEIIDGVTRGSERSEDMHGAVRRREVRFTSAIVTYQFRLDGAKMTTLSMNAEKGHVCRVKISEDGFSVVRDKDKAKNDKPVVLDQRTIKIAPKEWHTLVVEMNGKDMLARLDGKEIAYGAHDSLAVLKASVGFTVQGEAVSFKNLRVYEGTLKSDWQKVRDRLLEQRKK